MGNIFESFTNYYRILEENENYKKKVILVTIADISDNKKVGTMTGSSDTETNKPLSDALSDLFVHYSIDELKDKKINIPNNVPIIYYGGYKQKSLDFIEKNIANKDNLYNVPEASIISGDKVAFGKMFFEHDWLPKTVYSKNEALENSVGFPLVAKIKDGHSGLGIKVFKSKEELQKDKNEFDLFSECIDFDREYRCVFCKDECFIVNERIPVIGEKSTIKTKGIDEKVNFIYAYQDMKKIPWLKEIKEIAKEIKSKLSLGLWSLDIVIDKSGKIWVLETNTATGIGSAKAGEFYIKVYEDFYGKLPDSFKEQVFKDHISKGYLLYYPKYKKEIESSKYPIDYEKILKEYKK